MLARYFLMIRGWKMLCERNGVQYLSEVETFPFFAPEDAPDAEAAASALDTVQAHMGALAGAARDGTRASIYRAARRTRSPVVF